MHASEPAKCLICNTGRQVSPIAHQLQSIHVWRSYNVYMHMHFTWTCISDIILLWKEQLSMKIKMFPWCLTLHGTDMLPLVSISSSWQDSNDWPMDLEEDFGSICVSLIAWQPVASKVGIQLSKYNTRCLGFHYTMRPPLRCTLIKARWSEVLRQYIDDCKLENRKWKETINTFGCEKVIPMLIIY